MARTLEDELFIRLEEVAPVQCDWCFEICRRGGYTYLGNDKDICFRCENERILELMTPELRILHRKYVAKEKEKEDSDEEDNELHISHLVLHEK